jgi:hypothetical protein
VTQLKNKMTHPYNGKQCIKCGDGSKNPKHGYRGYPASHCSTCAKALQLINVSATLCEIELENGTKCPKQKKGMVGTTPVCGEHLKTAADAAEASRAYTCKIAGCNNVPTKGGYCRVCGSKAGVQAGDNCVDCVEPKRGSYKIGNEWLCKECKDTRIKSNAELIPVSTNPLCEICKLVRPSYSEVQGGRATRCMKCRGDNWHTVNPPAKPSTRVKLSDEELTRRKKLQHVCKHDGCTRSKAYGYVSDGKRLVCSDHVSDLEVRAGDPIRCVIKTRAIS